MKFPYSLEEFSKEFRAFFFSVTGRELSEGEIYHVAAYERGGMSSGAVSGNFWVKTLLPDLLKALNEKNAEVESGSYLKFPEVDLADVDCSPGEVLFSAKRGKVLLKVDYGNEYLLNVYMDKDPAGFAGFCVSVTKADVLIYLDESLPNEFYLREAAAKATKKLRELLKGEK